MFKTPTPDKNSYHSANLHINLMRLHTYIPQTQMYVLIFDKSARGVGIFLTVGTKRRAFNTLMKKFNAKANLSSFSSFRSGSLKLL